MLASFVQAVVGNATAPRVCTLVLFIEVFLICSESGSVHVRALRKEIAMNKSREVRDESL